MAVMTGAGSRIYLGAYDLSGESRSVDITAEADMADATVFNSAAREWVTGNTKYSVDHAGVFTNATAGWDKWLYDHLVGDTGQPITIIPGTSVEYSSVTYGGQVKEANSKLPIKVDDIIGMNASYQIAGGLYRGLLVANQTTAVGAYTGTAVNLGAAASTQMWALCIHIYEVNLNAATSYTVKITECGSEGGSYGDVAGCTKTVTAVGSLFYTLAGPRLAYVKVVGTPTGGAETAKFAVSLAVANLQ